MEKIVETIPSNEAGTEYVIKIERENDKFWYNAYRRSKGGADSKEGVRVASTKNLALTKRLVQNIIAYRTGDTN